MDTVIKVLMVMITWLLVGCTSQRRDTNTGEYYTLEKESPDGMATTVRCEGLDLAVSGGVMSALPISTSMPLSEGSVAPFGWICNTSNPNGYNTKYYCKVVCKK